MKRITLNNTHIVNFANHEVKHLDDGSVQTLEPRLVLLLTILVEHRGQVVSRQNLIQDIWGDYGNGDEYLTHAICKLRGTLGKTVIRTVPKKGYALSAHVTSSRPWLFSPSSPISLSKATIILLAVGIVVKMLFFPHH